jgi:hypothetical protein
VNDPAVSELTACLLDEHRLVIDPARSALPAPSHTTGLEPQPTTAVAGTDTPAEASEDEEYAGPLSLMENDPLAFQQQVINCLSITLSITGKLCPMDRPASISNQR